MTRHRLSLPVSVAKQYTLDVIRRKMPSIQLRIAGWHTTLFPKDRSRLKPFYEYQPHSLHRDRRGQLQGSVVRLVTTLFDFTFVHSLFALAYSARGGHYYDPASLFVLLVFAFVAAYEHLTDFVSDLHNPDREHQYRVFAGIYDEHIPQEADYLAEKKPKAVLLFHLRLHCPLWGVSPPDAPNGREVLRGLGLAVDLADGIFLWLASPSTRQPQRGNRVHCTRRASRATQFPPASPRAGWSRR